MARRLMAGFEGGLPHTNFPFNTESNMDFDALGFDAAMVGTITYQTAVARNGGRAMQCNPSGANYLQLRDYDHTNGQNTYARFYFRTNDATPSTTLQIWVWRINGLTAADIVLNTAGKLLIRNAGAASTIGTSAMTLSANTWYRIETRLLVNTATGTGATSLIITDEAGGTQETVFDGAASTGTALTPITHRCGHIAAGDSQSTVYVDDLAINDHTGAEQNSYPGPGNITLLKPVSDNAVSTGWTDGGGGTSNLYDAVNNVPPAGIATPANGTQIKNLASLGAPSNYNANCQTLEAAGGPAGATIKVAQAFARVSSSSNSGTNLMSVLSVVPADDPIRVDSEVTALAGADNSATVNTGWKTVKGPPMHSPALDSNDTPVVGVAKTELANTNAHQVDQMGMMVEWVPDTTPPTPNITSGPTLSRISSQTGKDSLQFTWESTEDFTNYKVKVVPSSGSPESAGTLVEADEAPTSGGTANTEYEAKITDDEIIAADPGEGTKILKIFVKDVAGNWSA